MQKQTLILASSSPRRLELLQQSKITVDQVIAADIDETPLKSELPRIYAQRVAKEKCEKIARLHPDAFVIAGDTVVACGRRILLKTDDAKEARQCLELLSGRRHKVMTAIAIAAPDGKMKCRITVSDVKFKRLSPAEIDRYVACEEWKGKAGGYAIQGLAATMITYIGGSYTGIVGLPAYETVTLLKGMGYEHT